MKNRAYVHTIFDHIFGLNNFVDENSNLIKFPPFMQYFIGNLLQFSEH